MTEFQIATIEDFDNSKIVQLPSQIGTKKAVRLQQPDIVQLFADGDAPDILSSVALSQLNGGQAEPNIEITKENIPDLLKTLDLICRACFVQPKIWNGKDKIKNDEMPISQIPFSDRMFVFQWALGAEYQPTKNFPEQPGEIMDNLQPVNGVSNQAE